MRGTTLLPPFMFSTNARVANAEFLNGAEEIVPQALLLAVLRRRQRAAFRIDHHKTHVAKSMLDNATWPRLAASSPWLSSISACTVVKNASESSARLLSVRCSVLRQKIKIRNQATEHQEKRSNAYKVSRTRTESKHGLLVADCPCRDGVSRRRSCVSLPLLPLRQRNIRPRRVCRVACSFRINLSSQPVHVHFDQVRNGSKLYPTRVRAISARPPRRVGRNSIAHTLSS